KSCLRRRSWGYGELSAPNKYVIESTFHHKFLVKANRIGGQPPTKSVWQPGINLKTFKALNGSFPSKEEIHDEIVSKGFWSKAQYHNDIQIFNMLIQGK